ncbi:membrane protein, putative [Methylophaga frappieri]|jgi:hypothetical protein|uniref:Membrane protein, putative n=1 Tax=Methylophaga frappieri (strain ATCC BAA-2434 / DSM 25690 / JAM7) TaxID=754477 RepID=I1YGL5_METFJ|nr:hypothetical protein [Methylophaga frappieri]AFJ02058.1 membrane protein, putative [Methylophaga frappieri]
MLRNLADFAMQGRWQAAITASFLAVTALFLPPLNYLASGLLVLATLRTGPREGAKVLLVALLVFTLAATWIFSQPLLAVILFVSSWLPVYLITLVLGFSRSLAKALITAGLIGLIGVAAVHVLVASPAAWWQTTLQPFVALLLDQPGWQLSVSETEAVFANLSTVMTGLFAAAIVFNAIVAVLIGRAWQASLYEPGAFGEEFRSLKLGKVPAVATAILMVLSISGMLDALPVLADMLPVMLLLFTLQGIAIVHALVKQKQKAMGWLIAMYVLLVLVTPQMASLLATFGITEQWFNFRKLPLDNAKSIEKQ